MKNDSTGTLRLAALTAACGAGLSSVALAGTPEPAPMMAPVEEVDNVISGSLSFDLNSHFVSYGADVWGGARSFGGDSTFNPSLELSWAMTDNFSLVLGTWWDMNDNTALSGSFGGDLQEVDIWAGGSYAFGDLSVSALYQAWMYGGGTEHIVDVAFAYDCFLSPSLTIHNRVGNTTSNPGDNGTVLVAGIEHGFDLGPVSFAIPVNAAFFLTDDFHGAAPIVNSDSGFGYFSVGLNASYPLAFIDDKYGEWDIHGGVTYYATESDVIPFNPSDTFFTWNVGIGCSF